MVLTEWGYLLLLLFGLAVGLFCLLSYACFSRTRGAGKPHKKERPEPADAELGPRSRLV
jgi:hypothetical protein